MSSLVRSAARSSPIPWSWSAATVSAASAFRPSGTRRRSRGNVPCAGGSALWRSPPWVWLWRTCATPSHRRRKDKRQASHIQPTGRLNRRLSVPLTERDSNCSANMMKRFSAVFVKHPRNIKATVCVLWKRQQMISRWWWTSKNIS